MLKINISILKVHILCLILLWSGHGYSTMDQAYCEFLYRSQHIGQKNNQIQSETKRTIQNIRPVRGGAPSAVPSLPEVWEHVQVQDKKNEDKFDVLIRELRQDREERRLEREESSRRFDEIQQRADKDREENNKKFDEMQQRADKDREESNKKFNEMQQNTDAQFKEIKRDLRKALDKAYQNDKQWGDFVEAIIEGDFIRIMETKNISIIDFRPDVKTRRPNHKHYQFDGIGETEKEVIVLEVKSTLRPVHVEHFVHKLKVFRKLFPEYKGLHIYGAIGYLNYRENAKAIAEREGLFLVKGILNNTAITNSNDFVPQSF